MSDPVGRRSDEIRQTIIDKLMSAGVILYIDPQGIGHWESAVEREAAMIADALLPELEPFFAAQAERIAELERLVEAGLQTERSSNETARRIISERTAERDAAQARADAAEAQVEALRPLADTATPGEWSAYFTMHGDPSVVTDPKRPGFTDVAVVSTAPADYGRANALFIAAACNFVRAALTPPDTQPQVEYRSDPYLLVNPEGDERELARARDTVNAANAARDARSADTQPDTEDRRELSAELLQPDSGITTDTARDP